MVDIGSGITQASANATEILEQANLGDSLGALSPLLDQMQAIMNVAQLFLGGIFGIYLILLILKWLESRKLNKTLKKVSTDMDSIKKDLSSIKRNLKK